MDPRRHHHFRLTPSWIDGQVQTALAVHVVGGAMTARNPADPVERRMLQVLEQPEQRRSGPGRQRPWRMMNSSN